MALPPPGQQNSRFRPTGTGRILPSIDKQCHKLTHTGISMQIHIPHSVRLDACAMTHQLNP
jgi:hypothetical protein